MDGLAESCIQYPRSVLAVDEAHLVLRKGAVSREVLRVFRGSRHFGVSIYIATQRLVDVDPDIRAVISDIFAYRTVSSLDLRTLRDELGVEEIDVLRSLSVGKYVYTKRIA